MELLDLLFPQRNHCFFCKGERDDDFLCNECINRLEFINSKVDIDGIEGVSILKYNNFLRGEIHRYKYQGDTYLGKFFGKIMSDAIQDLGINADLIISIPMDSFGEALRGYSPTKIIAREIERYTKIRYSDVLKKKYHTKRQSLSTFEERQGNLKGAFYLKEKKEVRGRNLLLIDDLYTTGATLREAILRIEEGNPNNIFFLTLAR